MLIFHEFPSRDNAVRFATAVRKKHQLDAFYDVRHEGTWALVVDAYRQPLDHFPFALTPPIVLVERTFDGREDIVGAEVEEFGGSYAGT